MNHNPKFYVIGCLILMALCVGVFRAQEPADSQRPVSPNAKPSPTPSPTPYTVLHNSTLTGNGTFLFPLGVAVPLSLTGSTSNTVTVNNTSTGIAVYGNSQGGNGVAGNSQTAAGVLGYSNSGSGVSGITNTGYAATFSGRVQVNGILSKSGGSFKIDHPLDPANKYLSHSFVESPDMMNVYNGNITTNERGEATVELPNYFEALNRDFRYQLTVIGQFAQAFVASEVSAGRFDIKTDQPNVKVSWQVTGIRQDAWANKNRIQVEEDKPAEERGYYLHPEVFHLPDSVNIQWVWNPEMMRRKAQN